MVIKYWFAVLDVDTFDLPAQILQLSLIQQPWDEMECQLQVRRFCLTSVLYINNVLMAE